MLIVSPSTATKRVGEESFVKRRDIVSLRSSKAADKDAGRLYGMNYLSDTHPCSAETKISSTFSILSDDFHKPISTVF